MKIEYLFTNLNSAQVECIEEELSTWLFIKNLYIVKTKQGNYYLSMEIDDLQNAFIIGTVVASNELLLKQGKIIPRKITLFGENYTKEYPKASQ